MTLSHQPGSRVPGPSRILLVLFGIGWMIPSPARAQEKAAPSAIGKLILATTPTPLLGGRLLIRMPKGARIEARRENLAAAAESEQHETRVIVDAGPERMVLLAGELFAFAGDDFMKNVRGVVDTWENDLGSKYRVEPAPPGAGGLRTVRVVPATPPDRSRSNDAVFIEGRFVESPDHTVQTVDVYANPAAANDLPGCSALAQQILGSMGPGSKRLLLEPGERRLSAYSNETEIAVNVPRNMVATVQRGPDFLVHHLIPLSRLGTDAGNVGIYLGASPDFHPGRPVAQGVVFGKKVPWQLRTEGPGWEALCERPLPGTFPKVAHVWIDSSEPAEVASLRTVAESIRVVKRRGASR